MPAYHPQCVPPREGRSGGEAIHLMGVGREGESAYNMRQVRTRRFKREGISSLERWGPWARTKRQWSEVPGEPMITAIPECCHCSGRYRHSPLPNSPKRCAALGVALVRLLGQRVLRQSRQPKYQPQKGTLKGKMWPLLVWSNTEKAVTISFSSAAAF